MGNGGRAARPCERRKCDTGNQEAKKVCARHWTITCQCTLNGGRPGQRTIARLRPLFTIPYSLLPIPDQTASDNEVNVKSRIFSGGIIITNGDSSSPTRTGLPISSMLLSMITGDSLKRKFLIGYLISPFSM